MDLLKTEMQPTDFNSNHIQVNLKFSDLMIFLIGPPLDIQALQALSRAYPFWNITKKANLSMGL